MDKISAKRKISTKLTITLVLAALLPMMLFGVISIFSSRQAHFKTVSEGNLNVAKRAAEQIELYVSNATLILQALADNINRMNLSELQKERIIKNYVMSFDEFHSIYVTDALGREVVTTDLGGKLQDRSHNPAFKEAIKGKIYISEVFISENLAPAMNIALPVIRLNRIEGVISGEIDLINMWNLVDSIKIGEQGYAFVVSRSGLIIAHGKSSAKPMVLKQENLRSKEIVRDVLQGRSTIITYRNEERIRVLGVSAPIKALGWGVIIEQPTSEAYSVPIRMTKELAFMMVALLLIMTVVGYFRGRQIVIPIRKLMESTRLISRGDLTHRVYLQSNDELSLLADSFNNMTERLAALQEEIRRNERSVMFGKIAAGLVHDLKHPIKSIENSSQLIMRFYEDGDYRKTFENVVKREFSNINKFLDDLHNLTHTTPLSTIYLNVNTAIEGVIEGCQEEAKKKNIVIDTNFHSDEVRIHADKFAFERITKNIIFNAIDAIQKDGEILIETKLLTVLETGTDQIFFEEKAANTVAISISDTGCGIPEERLPNLFDDYTTSKRKGLGLGLAISKKLVEDMDGTIEVQSKVDVGTTFTLKFPSP